MNISRKGLIELVGHEGVCLRPYKDSVGVWTIGVGHASTANQPPNPAKMSKTAYITMDEAFKLFEKSIQRYQNAVNKALKVEVTQEQFDALVSWCYNVGTGGMARSTAIRRINNRESSARVYQALMMWRKPPEIIGRRRKEAKLFRDGVYSNNGKALLFDTNGRGKVSYAKGKSINVADYLKAEDDVEISFTEKKKDDIIIEKPEEIIIEAPKEEIIIKKEPDGDNLSPVENKKGFFDLLKELIKKLISGGDPLSNTPNTSRV